MKLIAFLCLILITSGCTSPLVAPPTLPTAAVVQAAAETASPSPEPSPSPSLTAAPAPSPTASLTSTAPITASAGITSSALEVGIQVYTKSYCGVCHTLDAAGTRGVFAPDHNHMGTVAADRILQNNYTGTATTAAEYIRESIVDPRAYIVDEYRMTQHNMPAFTNLSMEEVDALVELLLAQK